MSTAVLEPTVDDLAALVDHAVTDDKLAAGSTWSVVVHDQWVGGRPSGAQLPRQGWKLHVSATAANAHQMVSRCLPVLLTTGCAFKVARSTEVVAELTGPQADRVQAGKVMTVYPVDEDSLRAVAAALVTATADLGGPRILTDRPVSPGSVVHYRYGAFTGVPTFGADGRLTAALRAPDGTTVIPVAKPNGVFVIREGKASWVPAVDANRIALIGVLTGLLAAVIGSLAVLRQPPWPRMTITDCR